MVRRTKNSDQVSQVRGRYRRKIGRWINGRGKDEPKTFDLGTEEQRARLANRLLERLWTEVQAERERWQQQLGQAEDLLTLPGNPPSPLPPTGDGHVRWPADALELAESARQGKTSRTIERRDNESEQEYAKRIERLRQAYTAVTALPGDEQAYKVGREANQRFVSALAGTYQWVTPAANGQAAMPTGYTIHAALKRFANEAIQQKKSEWGKVEHRQALANLHALPDRDVAELDTKLLEQARDYWAARPKSKRYGQPISIATADAYVRTLRRWVKWMDRQPDIPWSQPKHAQEALTLDRRGMMEEKDWQRLQEGPAVWTIDELRTLWHAAKQPERIVLALGLNCAFTQTEMAGLLRSEAHLDADPPWIERIRRKSGVFGQWQLWTETAALLREQPAGGEHVLGGIIPKSLQGRWRRLMKRVTAQDPKFRKLPLKSLRKTSYQLIRNASDGEIAAIHACHGQPVATDTLSDVYSQRPFDKVADALTKVRRELSPVFDV